MPLMKWDEQLSVNVKEVDGQHMKLVEILNSFSDTIQHGERRGAKAKALSDLLDYTSYHFSTEEELFAIHGYPGLTGHMRQHDAPTKDVTRLVQRFWRGEEVAGIEIVTFLKEWIQDHILHADKKYAPFLNARGVH